ncbi:MAG: FkbM family methyltransferase [Eubacteriales bacterium]
MSGIIQPLFYEPFKHAYKFVFNHRYRNYSILESKLRKVPRFTNCHARVNGWNLHIPDSASFLFTYKELFVDRIYEFQSNNQKPFILDLGANIGLSVLFFKYIFPNSEIIALEPDPNIYKYLKKNVHGNGFTDVIILNKAAWNESKMLKFCTDGADGGHASLEDDQNSIEVEAVDITEFLKDRPIDLLKMDIEGAEDVVIPACEKYFSNVKLLFIEYHSKTKERQCLDKLLNIIADAGFRIHIQSVVFSTSPFMEIKINSGFDLQLNIFGWKER